MALQLYGIAIIALIYVTLRLLSATDKPKIKGIPEIPGIPIFGNLLQLGVDHARVAQRWAAKYGPVFQARLGSKRVIFVNSYESVRHFWITHQSVLISRPTFHTFHSVISSSQGLTIGASPWDDSCKRKRKVAATALNRPAVQSYMPILDLESTVSIKELLEDCKDGTQDINPTLYIARLTLNTSLTLNYGFRISGNVNDELLREITHVERQILNFRSTSSNWQDFIPLLRLFSGNSAKAEEYRLRRDKYLADLLDGLRTRIANGTDKPCITGNILKDPEAKLGEAELRSICSTIVAAGLDTMPGNLVMGIAYLSTSEGQAAQAKALAAIHETYPNGDGWEKCLVEEKVSYITALIKEILRFWTVVPLSLPRTNIEDIPYKGGVIPAGTTFFMNAYAADYDESRFESPSQFIPERFLDDDKVGTPHYAYGAGSRMCIGSHLSNRQLYILFVRIIMSFELRPAQDPALAPIMNTIECNAEPASLSLSPKPFKINFKPRPEAKLREWIAASEERARDL